MFGHFLFMKKANSRVGPKFNFTDPYKRGEGKETETQKGKMAMSI